MDKSMRASVLTGPQTIELQERPVPQPVADEVLVRVGSVGVCGSDVHYYKHGRIGSMIVDGPLVLGHEVGGTIVAVGGAVDPARIGERVALEPQRPCRRCRQCKTGHLNLCPDMEFFATPPIDGAFCDYVTLPADFAHPVPDSLSDAAVGLLEPLSVGIWANHGAVATTGSRVHPRRTDPGAVAALSARAAGATDIIVSDPVESRRRRITSSPPPRRSPDRRLRPDRARCRRLPGVLWGDPGPARRTQGRKAGRHRRDGGPWRRAHLAARAGHPGT
jgi:L-iditol 2-dehydrogenase